MRSRSSSPSLRNGTETRAPASRSASTTAVPRAPVPPVTTADLPSRVMVREFYCRGTYHRAQDGRAPRRQHQRHRALGRDVSGARERAPRCAFPRPLRARARRRAGAADSRRHAGRALDLLGLRRADVRDGRADPAVRGAGRRHRRQSGGGPRRAPVSHGACPRTSAGSRWICRASSITRRRISRGRSPSAGSSACASISPTSAARRELFARIGASSKRVVTVTEGLLSI